MASKDWLDYVTEISGAIEDPGDRVVRAQGLREQEGWDNEELAKAEHFLFAKSMSENYGPVGAASMAVLTPIYAGAKALGLKKADTPPSFGQIQAGWAGGLAGIMGDENMPQDALGVEEQSMGIFSGMMPAQGEMMPQDQMMMGPDDMQGPPPGDVQQDPDALTLREGTTPGDRFQLNMMKLAYNDDEYGNMIDAMLVNSKDNIAKGIGEAVGGVAAAVDRGLLAKGVEVESGDKAAAIGEMVKQYGLIAAKGGQKVGADDLQNAFKYAMDLYMGHKAQDGQLNLTGSGNQQIDELANATGLIRSDTQDFGGAF